MNRLLGVFCVSVLALGAAQSASADDKDVTAVLDKAIKALGGEEKLAKAAVYSWKVKGSLNLNGNESDLTGSSTVQAPDRSRSEVNIEFNGSKFQVVTILNGDKGWRKIGDNAMPLDEAGLANDKRVLAMQLATTFVLPLKDKKYKIETAGEEKVDDKPATVLKVVGADGKDFKISFDKESGLPVKVVATVAGFMGEDYVQESLYKQYKDFNGIKRATKVEVKRDGAVFLNQEISDFKASEKAEPGAFDEPA